MGEEKKFNLRLSKPKEEFIKIMKDLKLAKPRFMGKIHEAMLSDDFYLFLIYLKILRYQRIWYVVFKKKIKAIKKSPS